MIEVRNLKKIYKAGDTKVRALDGVNLTIGDGEFLAVMGSSGSGKSTLLHIIAGVDAPTTGSVRIDGVDIHRLKPSEQAVLRRRSIGIIYQAYNLVPTLTVEENIILPLMLDGRRPAKAQVDCLLELLKLTDRRRHLPGQLSGGQQQRTAIGRALLAKPSVLLADEPTGNLDVSNTEEVLELLCQANREFGQTLVLVTHDPQVGERAKRQICITDGKVTSDRQQPPVGHAMSDKEPLSAGRAMSDEEPLPIGRATPDRGLS